MNHCRWNLLPPIPATQLVRDAALPPIVQQLLHNRGITGPAQINSFLTSDKSLLYDPFLLPDMHRAVSRVYQALLSGEQVVIYGDFDADGITATALLIQGLSRLGGNPVPYIPHRHNEGHGLSVSALKNLREQGATLIITVDCGVTNVAEVERAKKWGLDIIITDHHTPIAEIPTALAVVDPKLSGSAYPFLELSGAGVAFKLLQGLMQNLGRQEEIENVMDLVAIGTIADMSPLVAENRYLVREGLRLMNQSPRPGIQELMLLTGIKGNHLDADKISWIIGPCLNASGRLADASGGYRLMLTDSAEEARELAAWLMEKNEERQRLTKNTYCQAREQVISAGLTPLLMVKDEDYHLGINGLVASRLMEEFYRPVVVVKTGKKVSHASCRSIPEFNIIAALTRYGELFTQFGGHSRAAGFTMPTRNLPLLEEKLMTLATTQLAGLDLRPHLEIDAQVTVREFSSGIFPLIQQLAPFGQGNPLPTFLSRGVEVLDCRTMGNGSDHLRLKLKQDGVTWDAVAFNLGSYFSEIASPLDIVYNLEMDNWGGRERLRLCILDFAATAN
ncbi:single-stranded-DNA-specific exonuclease RecJ [Chloroflexota bacterium]